MRTLHSIASLFVAGLLITGCVRKQEVIAPTPDPVGGKGGVSTLNIIPQRHGKNPNGDVVDRRNVDSCTVYIKYNATNFPASMIFDDSMKVIQQGAGPTATFVNLSKGNYYIYGKGWDPEISEDVMGGQTFRIVDTMSYTVFLAVSEIH